MPDSNFVAAHYEHILCWSFGFISMKGSGMGPVYSKAPSTWITEQKNDWLVKILCAKTCCAIEWISKYREFLCILFLLFNESDLGGTGIFYGVITPSCGLSEYYQ